VPDARLVVHFGTQLAQAESFAELLDEDEVAAVLENAVALEYVSATVVAGRRSECSPTRSGKCLNCHSGYVSIANVRAGPDVVKMRDRSGMYDRRSDEKLRW